MRSTRGLGVLVMCGLVLGLMAVSASGAQAGMWMVNKANIGAGVKLVASFSAELEGGSVTLLSTSGANSVAITCTSATVSSSVIELEVITGKVNFSGCTTKINGKAEPNCNPIGQPVAAGEKATVALHEGGRYVRVDGNGGVLATFNFDDVNCVALSPSIKLTGTGWFEDCNNEIETERTIHLFQEARVPAEKLGGLSFGGNKATIDGSANFSFSDATHKGMTYSGLDV